MTAVLSPLAKQQFFDSNGRPLVGGKLFTYIANTTTKQPTYVDSAGVNPNPNPVILDYRGEANLWVPPNVGYKYVLSPSTDTDPPTHPIWTVDNVVSSQLVTLYGGVDTGVANAYVLNFVANFTAYQDGIVIYWIPSNTNTGPSTININGLGPVNLLNPNGSTLSANQLVAGQPATIIFKSGAFTLFAPQVGIPYRVYKPSNTARASTTVLTADPHLVVPGGTGTFAIEALLLFNELTTGAGGIQLGFYCTGGAGLAFNPQMLAIGSVNGATYSGKGAWNIAVATVSLSIATVSIAGANDALHFVGTVVGSAAGSIGFSWAQNASNVNTTAMLAGSWMQSTQLS